MGVNAQILDNPREGVAYEFTGVKNEVEFTRMHPLSRTAFLQCNCRRQEVVVLGHNPPPRWFCTLSLQGVVSGETKGKDTFAGVPDNDSAETLVYVGPQLNFTWGSRRSALLAADLPVVRNNSGTQVMPDYRIRAALNWRF